MTMKSLDLAHLRSIVLAGHAGAGKTTLAEQLLFRAGAIPRLGRVDDGTAHLDFEPEEQKRTARSASPSARSSTTSTRHARRHARLPGLHRRGDPGLRRRRRRAVRDGRVGRRRGRPRGGGHAGPRDRHGRLLRAQQVRPRERGPDGRPRRAARDVRQQDRAAAHRHRRGRDVQRLRRPRPPQGLPVRGRQGGRDPDPGRAGRRGRAAPRPAARGGRRGRRRRVRRSTSRARRSPTRSSTRASTRASASRSSRRCSWRRRAKGIGIDGAARRDRPLPALARGGEPPSRRPTRRGKVEVAAESDERPARSSGCSRRRGPVRRPADVPARPLRHAQVPGHVVQRHAGRGRADRPAADTSTARSRSPPASCGPARSARSRSWRHRDRRHALDARAAAAPAADRLPGPDPRSPSTRVQGATSTRWAPRSSGCSRRSRPPASSGPRPASRSCGRSARPRSPSSPSGSSASSARRSRPARRRSPTARRSAARRKAHGRYKKQTGGHGMFGDVWIELEPNPAGGVEFAEQGRRRLGARKGFFAGVEKGIRETAAEGVARGLPADRLQGDAVRRLVPPRRLERAVVQDRGVDGAQGRRPAGEAGAARADHDRRGPHPRAVHGRGQPRPQRPPRPGPRAWTPRTGSR